MDITTLLSGFIGSFLGVASGFFGAVYLDWRRSRNERRTHILALMREILSNNVRVQLMLKEGRRDGALEDRAWRDLSVPLAGQLPSELYHRIASRYDAFGRIRRAYDEMASEEGTGDDEARGELDKWADGMMEEHEHLRAQTGSPEGLLRALRRRARRHGNGNNAAKA